jgi:thermitase
MNPTLRRALTGAVALAATAVWTGPGAALAAGRTRPRYVEGEVIVKFKGGVGPTLMGAVAARGHAEATIAKRLVDPETGLGEEGVALARFPKSVSVQDMVARYRALPEVAYAEPNYIASKADVRPSDDRSVEPAFVKRRVGVDAKGLPRFKAISTAELRSMAATYPVDPSLISQWGWFYVGADIVWPDTKAAMVAVVDTGVDAQHPDLMGRVVNGFDFVNNDSVPNDDNGHGTHVAGIISAKNNDTNGIAGVSRGKVYAVKVLDATGLGTHFDVAQGIRKAANYTSVKVINVSLGGDQPSATLQGAVEYATVTKGKLIVAAAGNLGTTDRFYPAAYSDFLGQSALTTGTVDLRGRILAVAASGVDVPASSTNGDTTVFVEFCRAPYSNYGDWVNITAPGTDIYSTTPYKKEFYGARYFDDSLDGYNTYSGTSMASPHVAAVAARVWGTFTTLKNKEVFSRVTGRGLPALVGQGIDVDGDNVDDLTECWESGFQPPNTLGPGYLVETNVATTLGRGRVTGRILDATTGLGLTGAVASLAKGSTMVGYGGGLDSAGVSYYDIINVPWNDPGTGAARTPPYKLRVSRSGYASGVQVVDDALNGGTGVEVGPLSPLDPTQFDGGSPEAAVANISLPPLTANYTFVTDWGSTGFTDLGTTNTELDTYLWLPSNSGPSGIGCSIGFDLISGDCGDAGPTGTLLAYPWARWFRDGGTTDGLGTEATGIRKLLSTTVDPYHYAVQDPILSDGTAFTEPDSNPVVRLWKSGVVKKVIRYADHTPDGTCIGEGGMSPCDWWSVGTLTSAGALTVDNRIGDGSTVIPYRVGGGPTRITVGRGVRRSTPSTSGSTRTSNPR